MGWQGEPGLATAYVRLLGTSRMDTPARTVDEVVLYDVRLDDVGDDGIEFRLTAKELGSRTRYQVGVLVDLARDGQKSAGNYINTRPYPVLTREFPEETEVHVHRIGRRACKDIEGPPEDRNCL